MQFTTVMMPLWRNLLLFTSNPNILCIFAINLFHQMDKEPNIQTLTTSHEGQTFDRKSARIDPKGLSVVLVAMANADGGTIAIGIEDNGTVTGIDRFIGNINDLLRVPIDYCVPKINVHPEYLDCINNEGGADHILLLHVEQSNRLHATSADEAYIRIGDKSHKLGFEERMQLMFAKGVCYFEDEPVARAGIEDLDLKYVEEYCARIGYVREFGEGIDRIYKEMAEVGQPAPEFKQSDFMLRATIRKGGTQDVPQGVSQGVSQGVPQGIPQAIFKLISANNKITRESIATQLELSSKTIARYLKQMSDRVHYVGSGYSGHWEVIISEKKD